MPGDALGGLTQAVATAQREYRTYYETCIEAFRKEKRAFKPELLILVNGPADVPKKYRLWRCDGIWKKDGRSQPGQFELGRLSAGEAITERHGSGVSVTLHPIVWHRCEFYFVADVFAWDSLDLWQTKWIDEFNTNQPDAFGLAGVIHWLSKPNSAGNRHTFLVDFGSAPTAALHELLAVLAAAGVGELTIASFGHKGDKA
jgi:hypothetical protein